MQVAEAVEYADLRPSLDRWNEGPGRLNRRLASALRRAIDAGDLAAGTRLPPERALADSLGISRTTVVGAYGALERDGLLERRQGSGTRVRGGSAMGSDDERETSRLASKLLVSHDGAGDTIALLSAYVVGEAGIPLEATEGLGRDLVGLSREHGYSPLGYPPLRRAIAQYYTELGLPTSDEQILVTHGAQHAIALIAAASIRPGDLVVIEDPTYHGAIDTFSTAGARFAPISTDRWGASVDGLRERFENQAPRLAYLMPTYHNPVGGVMPESRRRDVARLAETTQITVVEDHTISWLALDGDPPPPIATYGPDAPILTIASLSKLFWAGLRVGWVRGPRATIAELGRVRVSQDLGGSLPAQVLAARLFGYVKPMHARRRVELCERLDAMGAALAEHLPSWRWDRPRGGPNIWAHLPMGSAQAFVQVAARHGVDLASGAAMSPRAGFDDHIRLPFGGHEPAVLREAVQRIARAWDIYAPSANVPQRTSVLV
ncbi:MAG: PLP-dependent aminotransferase family protein [Chloroflexi bacterium]|nr:PLP-dependent aminotransferase family protein [Chloroflexota bacterium]